MTIVSVELPSLPTYESRANTQYCLPAEMRFWAILTHDNFSNVQN